MIIIWRSGWDGRTIYEWRTNVAAITSAAPVFALLRPPVAPITVGRLMTR